MKNPIRLTDAAALLLILISLTMASPALAYPPDNAAVLYYKATQLTRIDPNQGQALTDLRQGKIELNDTIKATVRENREALIALLDACEVKDCDWGINYARGFELMSPRYGGLRELATLVVAQARIAAQEGDTKTALNRCLSLHKMAHHVNDRLFVSYLVGISINAMAHDCMTEILSSVTPNAETLTWLKSQLRQMEDLPLSIEPALDGERQAGAISITIDKMAHVLDVGFDDPAFQKQVLEKVAARDEAFFAKNRENWNQYWSDASAAFELPYPQAHARLRQLYEECTTNPNATFMIALVPACERICTLTARSRTHYNAVLTAIDLYLAKARTGRLPDSLPADALRDQFSGEPFRYEKTANGFTLRCQGKDLDKDKTYEYAFKIAK